jgi:hypothetical protein
VSHPSLRPLRRLCLAAAILCLGPAACTPGRLDAVDLGRGDLSTDLVAHYTFDEGSGATVYDHSGNKHDGTLVDAGSWITDGKFAGALRLDGRGYVTVPSFPNAPASFTVAGWIRTADPESDAGLQSIASTEYVFDAGWEMNVYKQTDGGRLQAAFFDRDAGTYTYLDCWCLPSQTWVHFAFVVDAANHLMTIYANGRSVGTTAAPEAIVPGTPALSIGAWSQPGRLLVGDLDDLVIYARALSSDEIVALILAPPPLVP